MSAEQQQPPKFFFEDLDQIQLTFDFTNPTPSLTPYVRLYIQHFPGDPYIFHDQVPLSNTDSPQKMFISYSEDSMTKLKFEVIIPFTGSKQILGQSVISLTDFLHSRKQSRTFIMDTNYKLKVSWTPPERSPLDLQMTIENINLKFSNNWFSKSDVKPCFKLMRCVSEAEDVLIYTSEQISPKRFNAWNKFTVNANDLCKGDQWSPIKVVVYDKREESEKPIGEGIFSLEQLFGYQNIVTLADEGRQRSVGTIRVLCEVTTDPTFSDYMREGLKFNTMLAVDFSDSQCKKNGLPSNHYAKNDRSFSNDYQKALTGLWHFLSKANNSSRLPVYGLGGSKKYVDSATDSCFDLRQDQLPETPAKSPERFNATGPWVSSLNELMIGYENMVLNAKLGGKCRIAGVIEKAKYLAKFNTLYKNQEYTLLVILTDGHIDDFDQAVRSLRDAEKLPLSVMFIGVGDEDMVDLEIMEKKLESECSRSCMSYIKYNHTRKEKKLLVKDILKEVPRHIKDLIEKEKEAHKDMASEFVETEVFEGDSGRNGVQETRENFLKRKLPFMMKDWICENNKREFLKAKEMIDVVNVTFGTEKTVMYSRS